MYSLIIFSLILKIFYFLGSWLFHQFLCFGLKRLLSPFFFSLKEKKFCFLHFRHPWSALLNDNIRWQAAVCHGENLKTERSRMTDREAEKKLKKKKKRIKQHRLGWFTNIFAVKRKEHSLISRNRRKKIWNLILGTWLRWFSERKRNVAVTLSCKYISLPLILGWVFPSCNGRCSNTLRKRHLMDE